MSFSPVDTLDENTKFCHLKSWSEPLDPFEISLPRIVFFLNFFLKFILLYNNTIELGLPLYDQSSTVNETNARGTLAALSILSISWMCEYELTTPLLTLTYSAGHR